MDQKKPDRIKNLLSFAREQDQKIDWYILIFLSIVGYIIIQICYPYPVTISDSGNYVNSAMQDTFSFYRPFGYSFFLQKLHFFSGNIHSIFIVQLIIYLFSIAAFAFSLKQAIPPVSKKLWYAILFCMIFNPIALFMANTIMSDLIFAAIIFVILTAFIYVIKNQSWFALSILMLSLFCILHVRYSAIIFPILFVILFIFMTKGKMRWIAILSTLLVILVFYSQVQNNMKKIIGIKQYSTGFDGWQLANNALHMIPFIDLDTTDIDDQEIKVIHQLTTPFKNDILKYTKGGSTTSANFMWSNDLPLKTCLNHFQKSTGAPYHKSWIYLGSGPYKKYGRYLIKKYPAQFLKYFYLPNSKQVFYPTTFEIFEYPESAATKPDIVAWYDNMSDSTDANPKCKIYNNVLMSIIQVGTLCIWLLMAVLTVAAIIYRKQWKMEKDVWQILMCITLFGLIYYTFTVFAGPVQLRFWTPMGVLQFSYIYILSNQLINIKKNK